MSKASNELQIIAFNKGYIYKQLHNKKVPELYVSLKETAKKDINDILTLNDIEVDKNHAARPVFSDKDISSLGKDVQQLIAIHSWPCAVTTISSYFGYRIHPIFGTNKLHNGIDIKAASGTPVYAWSDGIVTHAGFKGDGYGKSIVINHGAGLRTGYAHCSEVSVKTGDRVFSGTLIGKVGSTGFSTGPHLHFIVYKNGVPVNPMKGYLNGQRKKK